MCGFFVSNDPSITEEHEKRVEAGLFFRGPDSQSGLVEHFGWQFYHSRLAIIAPTSEYVQPFTCPDGSILVFNGEIFNFKELGQKHIGLSFQSDTEALAHLLTKPGFDKNELDGFFAFVRVSKEGVLLDCVRDHFGVKPLFVYRRGDFVTICSEPGVLSEIFSLQVSPRAVEEYRIFRGPIFQGSFFEGVSSVKPGHCVVNGKYFDSLDYDKNGVYETVSGDEIEESIHASVLSRHVSDVPIGLLYSGGVDSNLIYQSGPKLSRYNVGFEGDYDLTHAESEDLDSDEIALRVSAEEFRDRFNFLLDLRKEPMSVPNEVMLSIIAGRAKRDGFKVLLSGEGADEFFAGYDRIYGWAAQNTKFSTKDFSKHYCYGELSEKSDIFVQLSDTLSSFGDLSSFERVRQFFVKFHLPLLFRRLDFALMSAGVEGREPLASLRMFKLAMRLGPEQLLKDGLGKQPLRHLLSKSLGREFAFRQKVGFPVDIKKIFYGDGPVEAESYEIWFDKNLESII